ncbi:hypothetical protein DLE01_02325, partial [Streptomyces sp. FT05W]
MKIALMDSGIGLLAAAAAVRRLRPDADLVLSSDPGSMPWGPRTPEDVTRRALAVAQAAAAHRPDALIVACNTASVHALPTLRAELEPGLPVIGTVPAIKPAAAGGGPFAIWATPATTGSPYQRGLINDFARAVDVTEVPCPGLADAVEHADEQAIDRAVAAAAALTPPDVTDVVLGCTHYELVAEAARGWSGESGPRTTPYVSRWRSVTPPGMRGQGPWLACGMSTHSGTEVLRYTAFSADPEGGNPAGIVLDASGLGDAEMLAVAADLGYSESAFLTDPDGHGGHTVRYFSPKAEVPFCGHATVAAALALAERDGPGDLVFSTPAGPVPVTVVREGGELRATLTSVEPHTEDVAPEDL